MADNASAATAKKAESSTQSGSEPNAMQDSTDFDCEQQDNYDDYDDFAATGGGKGSGGGGGGSKSGEKGGKSGGGSVYSAKHVRARAARGQTSAKK